MDIAVGDMRSRVQVYQNTPVKMQEGSTIDNYALSFSTRGCLRQSSGAKTLEDGQLKFYQKYTLTVRDQVAWSAINADTALSIDGNPFKIVNIIMKDQIKHQLTFQLESCPLILP